jgi:alkylation response protein AidB-like acyl-CoA dehydrogenase
LPEYYSNSVRVAARRSSRFSTRWRLTSSVARAAYEYALEYACQREQFGKKIAEFQAVAFKLADIKSRIDASRLLVWRAGWMQRNNQPFASAEGSMAKLFASETAVHVTDEAIQILGGNGYTRDYPVERIRRDSKIFTIFVAAFGEIGRAWETTSEVRRCQPLALGSIGMFRCSCGLVADWGHRPG